VEVFLIDRKREVVAVQPGDDFHYGTRLPPGFPVDQYRRKWQRRGQEEPDDGTVAPGSWSSFLWEGVRAGPRPVGVLKGAWCKEDSHPSPNCDGPFFSSHHHRGAVYSLLKKPPDSSSPTAGAAGFSA
jgi:hypothetical protein